jgi:ferredoxin
MAINKVWIMEGCKACGLCGNLCPEVLMVNGTANVVEGVIFAEYENLIKCTAECCPAEVIRYSEQMELITSAISVYKRNKNLLQSILTGNYFLN